MIWHENTTCDTLLRGLVSYRQPKTGYRVSVEAPLLAAFVASGLRRPLACVLDLASGPGAIALMLLKKSCSNRAVFFDVDAIHCELAQQNAQENGLASLSHIVHGSTDSPWLTSVLDRFPYIVSNPPYFETTQGPISPNEQKAHARAFSHGSFLSFARAARSLLEPKGKFAFSFPSSSLHQALATCRSLGLHAKRLKFLYPKPNRMAQIAFIEVQWAKPGGLSVEVPWTLRNQGEAYSDPCERILNGDWSLRWLDECHSKGGEQGSVPDQKST